MRLGASAQKDGGTESKGVECQGIYLWQPCERQPPFGTVTLHEDTVEMNWYLRRGEGKGGVEQQEN